MLESLKTRCGLNEPSTDNLGMLCATRLDGAFVRIRCATQCLGKERERYDELGSVRYECAIPSYLCVIPDVRLDLSTVLIKSRREIEAPEKVHCNDALYCIVRRYNVEDTNTTHQRVPRNVNTCTDTLERG